jgi:hypothetical protein
LGVGVLVDSQIFKGKLQELKPNGLRNYLYHWKDLNEGYNFALDLISIEGLHTKLWGPKAAGVPTLRISKLPFGSFKTKYHLDVGLMERHRV